MRLGSGLELSLISPSIILGRILVPKIRLDAGPMFIKWTYSHDSGEKQGYGSIYFPGYRPMYPNGSDE